MRAVCLFALCVLVGSFTQPAYPVSLSGVVLYTTDDSGNPSGWDEADQDFAQRQLWRTESGSIWHGLGILPGYPPGNLAENLLNAADFTVDVPLVEGPNAFTLVGEPGGYTSADVFTACALHLYLDGVVDTPAISVVFSSNSPPEGGTPWPNESAYLYSLSLKRLPKTAARTSYEAGGYRAWVERASFLPPTGFLSVDLVSAYSPVPSGTSDWVGLLTIQVEGPPTPTPGAVVGPRIPAQPVSPLQFGIVPDGVPDAGSLPGLGRSSVEGETPINSLMHAAGPADDVAHAAAAVAEDEPTRAQSANATAEGTPEMRDGTPTARPTAAATPPTPGPTSRATPSPAVLRATPVPPAPSVASGVATRPPTRSRTAAVTPGN